MITLDPVGAGAPYAAALADTVPYYTDEVAAIAEALADDHLVPFKEYQRLAVVLDAAGWQLHSHAIGDRAVRVALDAHEAARYANGRRARRHRHTVAHPQFVHPRDYPRFKETGALACMQLHWAVRNEWTLDALRPFIGDERFRRMYPARGLERAGARLVGGTDWPVDPLRPFYQIATAIDRTQYDAVPRPLNADQGISRTASLVMHTRGSAFQLHEGRTGTVARGQVADLVVVDRDLRKVGPRSIRGASVRNTLIDGKVVTTPTRLPGGRLPAAARRSPPQRTVVAPTPAAAESYSPQPIGNTSNGAANAVPNR